MIIKGHQRRLRKADEGYDETGAKLDQDNNIFSPCAITISAAGSNSGYIRRELTKHSTETPGLSFEKTRVGPVI